MATENKKQKSRREKDTTSRLMEPYRVKSWAAGWRRLVNIGLLFITLEIAILSVERAQWINPQPSLTLALILAMLVTWLLARSRRLPGAVIHILAVFTGLPVTMWQALNLMTAPDTGSRFSQLMGVIQSWWQAAGAAPAGMENLAFAVFLVLLTWLIGYVSTWFLLRRHNPWAGVSLGALVVLVNLSNLTDRYYLYLGLYILAAALLVAHARITRHPDTARISRKAWTYIGAALLCAVVLAGSVARFTPELYIPQLQTFIATHTLWKSGIEQSRLNFFNTVPAKVPVSTSGTHSEQTFEGTWHQSEKIDFIIRSPRPSYWRVHVYDVYKARGWENGPSIDYLLDQKAFWGGGDLPAGPGTTTYAVSTNLKTDILIIGGSFLSSNNPSLVEVSAGDIVAVSMPRILRPGEDYTVTSWMFTPSPNNLAGAGGVYPQAISDYYLQLPADFPANIRQLSKDITGGAGTPYEKVLAISKYLSKIPYQEKINVPPNVDGVENFLFQQKSGFCLYYASAMAVMLRSVDVPTRLVVGYLPGEPGKDVGEYVLRDKHYHAWPQVYFNGYGWIDLEATPGGTGSGVTIESPWISGDAIAQLPEWDVWLTTSLEPPDMPNVHPTPAPSAQNGPAYGPFFLAPQLGLAILIILAAAFIFAVLATPVLILRSSFYRWLWHVNRDDLASLAYDKMCHLAAMVGLGPRPQQTPLEFAAVLSGEFPEQAGSFNHIARTYVENKFGRKRGLGLFEEAELLKARCGAFDSLLKRLGLAGKITRGRY